MITEEMTVMALQYNAKQYPLGYTFFRNHPQMRSDGAMTFGAIVAIYDKDGNPCPKGEFVKIQMTVLRERQRLYRERNNINEISI
jgi:hypothetical protein